MIEKIKRFFICKIFRIHDYTLMGADTAPCNIIFYHYQCNLCKKKILYRRHIYSTFGMWEEEK